VIRIIRTLGAVLHQRPDRLKKNHARSVKVMPEQTTMQAPPKIAKDCKSASRTLKEAQGDVSFNTRDLTHCRLL
jgi:hypothetical protein